MTLLSALLVLQVAHFAFADQRAIPVERDSSRYISAPANTVSTVQGDAADQRLWELFSQLERLQQEVSQLRGELEQQNFQIDTMKRQQRERYLDLDQRLVDVSAKTSSITDMARKSQSSSAPNQADASAAAAAIKPAISTTAKRIERRAEQKVQYDKAKGYVISRDWAKAKASLSKLIRDYPDGFYEPYSHYWLGLVYLAMPQAEPMNAQVHFRAVVERFPEHSKVPDSLYKLGQIYDADGKTSKAKSTLESVVVQHSGSSSAKLAREYLEQMRKR